MTDLFSVLVDSTATTLVMTDAAYDERLFVELVQCAARARNMPLNILDVKAVGIAAVEQQLSMSFLGEQRLYALGNLNDLAPKDLARIRQILISGSSVHVVIAFELSNKDVTVPTELQAVTIPSIIQPVDLERCIALFQPDEQAHRRVMSFFRQVAQSGQQLTLTIIVTLLPYALVIGQRAESFINLELPRIIQADHSLFDLSTAFFAGDVDRFKELFTGLSLHYQEPFWVVYFSEQIFRAYWFIKYRQLNKTVDAQKIAYRLPYSLAQRDWRKHKLPQLFDLHNQLCLFDKSFKNGASAERLSCALISYCTAIR